MVTHVVLFTPKDTLRPDERAQFVAALEHALTSIPLIRRAQVGRRVRMDRPYDRQNAVDFPFAAILEFDSADDLRAYLDHEAHHALGQQFYLTAAQALAFDFEILEPDRLGDLLV